MHSIAAGLRLDEVDFRRRLKVIQIFSHTKDESSRC
jgi:hypothetical protein